MMSEQEKKESRRMRNHAYYIENHRKWIDFYPRSQASEIGTGNLSGHRLRRHDLEHEAIRAEMRRIGLYVSTQKYTGE